MAHKSGDHVYFLFFGALIFFGFALLTALGARRPMLDFELAYNSTRCLLHGCDPYSQHDVLGLLRASGETYPSDQSSQLIVATRNVYPPGEFAVILPFALIAPGLAKFLWIAATAVLYLATAVMLWVLVRPLAPGVGGVFLGFILATSFPLFIYNNPGCLAVGLVGVAACCFLLERWETAAAVLLAGALLLKPQDAGMAWLFFLLAGGTLRRGALKSLAIAFVFAIPLVVWTGQLSPHWANEMHQNLTAFTRHGGINDPGPSAVMDHGTCVNTSLAPVLANLWDNAGFYSLGSLALIAPLVFFWARWTLVASPGRALRAPTNEGDSLRSGFDRRAIWLGLAAAIPLTLLPVYHRIYDARLIILTVPACALLASEGGRRRWLAIGINGAAILATCEPLWAAVLGYVESLHLPAAVFHGRLLAAAFGIPTPVSLVVLSAFYLWVYREHCRGNSATVGSLATEGES